MQNNSPLASEWHLLQSQYHDYERQALYIKLFAFIMLVTALINSAQTILACVVLTLIWLQEAIWRTFQSRVQQRILTIEKALADSVQNESLAFQHHSQFIANKPGIIGLIGQYLKNGLSPTVAFPHAIFILGLTVKSFL